MVAASVARRRDCHNEDVEVGDAGAPRPDAVAAMLRDAVRRYTLAGPGMRDVAVVAGFVPNRGDRGFAPPDEAAAPVDRALSVDSALRRRGADPDADGAWVAVDAAAVDGGVALATADKYRDRTWLNWAPCRERRVDVAAADGPEDVDDAGGGVAGVATTLPLRGDRDDEERADMDAARR